MSERYVELHERYPESRTEDITDAYLRGFQSCTELMYNNPLEKENELLRKLIKDMWHATVLDMECSERDKFNLRMRSLGIAD